ncbi:MAG: universal stress protein [SAR324 cluster bacterium]|nr:universal stress protein [SAR324 cluster bacterium]
MSVPSEVPAIEYKKILYTTELSESGRFAFHHAASLTNHYGAELTVFHVVKGGPELDRGLFGYITEKLWEEIKSQNLNEAIDTLVSRKRDNAIIKERIGEFYHEVKEVLNEHAYVAYDVVVKMGDPVEQIIKQAESENYDLIVMANHGHGSLRTTMMGDTVKEVVRRCKVPVLVVRVPEEE